MLTCPASNAELYGMPSPVQRHNCACGHNQHECFAATISRLSTATHRNVQQLLSIQPRLSGEWLSNRHALQTNHSMYQASCSLSPAAASCCCTSSLQLPTALTRRRSSRTALRCPLGVSHLGCAAAATSLLQPLQSARSCRARLLLHRLHRADAAAVAVAPGSARAAASGAMHPASCVGSRKST
jgi:hypothetical protein